MRTVDPVQQDDERQTLPALRPLRKKKREVNPLLQGPALYSDMSQPLIFKTGVTDLDGTERAHNTLCKH